MLFTCDSYLLDDGALALKSYFKDGNQSKIYRLDGIYYSKMCPITLLEKVCLRHGSTKRGRIDAVKKMLAYKQRTPLILIPNSVGAFPTKSDTDLLCIWIFNHPIVIEALGKGKSTVTLANGEDIMVPASKHLLMNQQAKLNSALHRFEKILMTSQLGAAHKYLYKSHQIIKRKEDVDAEFPMKIAEKRASYRSKRIKREDD